MKPPALRVLAMLAPLLLPLHPLRAEDAPNPPAVSATAPQIWSEIMLIGASVTRGFTQEEMLGGPKTEQYRLDRYLSAALVPEHAKPKNVALALFFLNPVVEGRRQLGLVKEDQPTVVVGLDFLFWYCYGPNKSELVRAKDFETGLADLAKLSCPLVLGDLPDISGAVGGIVTADEIPAPATLAAANTRLYEWAKTRPNVMVVPLAKFMAAVSNNEGITSGRHMWAAGTTRTLLQADKLHPGRHGAAALALAICEALHTGPPALALTNVRWDPEEVFKRGSAAPP